MKSDRIAFIARVLNRINQHHKAGRITTAQRLKLFAAVVAEYGQG